MEMKPLLAPSQIACRVFDGAAVQKRVERIRHRRRQLRELMHKTQQGGFGLFGKGKRRRGGLFAVYRVGGIERVGYGDTRRNVQEAICGSVYNRVK